MLLKGDFHTHYYTNTKETRWKNIEIICKNCIEFGFNAVYLGCHDRICEANFVKKAEDLYNLVIITGAELTTTGGHLLAYNIKEIPKEIKSSKKNPVDIELTIDFIHKLGGKAVAAHPSEIIYKRYNKGIAPDLNKILQIVDGAEYKNLRGFLVDGEISYENVKNFPNLKLFTSSDCHPWEINSKMDKEYFTEVESEWFNL